MLRGVHATRYLAPLREGGSLPGLMEADDLGTSVVKFHGAGQGRKALVAEVISGEMARALGLPVPDMVVVQLDPALAAGEGDPEIQELLRASAGQNLGMDFLPGALDFEPAAFTVDGGFAGRVLWFDALVGNVDRSWRNPNMLCWHREPYLIDHGSTLTFHHRWDTAAGTAGRPYESADHVLIGFGPEVEAADAELTRLVTDDLLHHAVAQVPEPWLAEGSGTRENVRGTYVAQLRARPAARPDWLPGVVAAAANGHGDRQAQPRGRNRPGLAVGGGVGPVSQRLSPFEYALLRVVPRVNRGETLNAGVLVYCQALDYLGSRVHLDVTRLHALDSTADPEPVERALHGIAEVCAATPRAGPAAHQDIGRRFRWLTAPRSTVVQPGPVHTGLTNDPDADADHLLRTLVLPL